MSIRALRTYPAFVSTVFEIPQSVGIHVPVFGEKPSNVFRTLTVSICFSWFQNIVLLKTLTFETKDGEVAL